MFRGPLGWAIGGFTVIGIAALVYVLGAALTTPDRSGLREFARGELSGLLVLGGNAPERPLAPFQDGVGQELTLAAFDGRVTLVNIWATWCAPCVREMPSLDRLAAAFDENDFLVTPITVDTNINDARDFYAEFELENLPLYHDPNFAVVRGLTVTGFPTGLPITVVYDASGVEVARLAGDAEWDSPEAIALIERVIADSFPETGA